MLVSNFEFFIIKEQYKVNVNNKENNNNTIILFTLYTVIQSTPMIRVSHEKIKRCKI